MAYTDGFTDARDGAGDRLGFRRLYETLTDLGARPAADVIDGLSDKLDEFQTGAYADDTAALALHRLADDERAPSGPAHETHRADTIITPA